MKYVLSRKIRFLQTSGGYRILLSPTFDFPTNKTVVDFLLFFTKPNTVEKVNRFYHPGGKIIADLIDKFRKEKVLVSESQNQNSIIKQLKHVKNCSNFPIYADITDNTDIINSYEKLFLRLADLFYNKLQVNVKKYFICLFFDRNNFLNAGGKNLPDWTRGYVSQDCIVLQPENATSESLKNILKVSNMRSMSHELAHVLTYQHCRFAPDWLSEGISEHIACSLFPKIRYNLRKRNTMMRLDYFFDHPHELLIDHDTNRVINNRLYFEAGQFVKKLATKKGLKSLLNDLSAYKITEPINKYLINKGYQIS